MNIKPNAGLFVLLDANNQPESFDSKYALQSDGTTVADGLDLDDAEYIASCVNAHDALMQENERLRKENSELQAERDAALRATAHLLRVNENRGVHESRRIAEQMMHAHKEN